MEAVAATIGKISGVVWGLPMLVILVGTGVYMTIRLAGIQFRGFTHAWALISGRYDKDTDPGEITHFQALATALSATIGTGNIAGVATAIAAGGPGAVFWMWVTAVFGMSLKFSSCALAVRFRRENPDGTVSGGPMHFLAIGLGWKWLGWLFALFAMIASFGIGNMVQANSVADAVAEALGVAAADKGAMLAVEIGTGLVLAVLTALVILGGIKRIAKVAQAIVPFMSAVYVAAALAILVMSWDKIPGALGLIFKHAFQPWSAAGGVAGYAVAQAMRFGVARGVFSNESGLGSAPMAHAAARTKEPVREGLVAMVGPFIDTIIICTMTALVILVSGLWEPGGPDGATLTSLAFDKGMPVIGQYVVGFGLVFFAYSTLIAWSYYGDRSAEFLFGPRAVTPYRILFCLLIPVGAVGGLKLIWAVSDVMNALMALPNLIGILLLSPVVARLAKDYFARDRGSIPRA